MISDNFPRIKRCILNSVPQLAIPPPRARKYGDANDSTAVLGRKYSTVACACRVSSDDMRGTLGRLLTATLIQEQYIPFTSPRTLGLIEGIADIGAMNTGEE